MGIPASQASLLISTYNWKEALDIVLRSVVKQSVMPGEVIVADDGSKLDTAQLIEQYKREFPTTLLHEWHDDKGFRKSVVLNRAIKKATGDYIIQIDGDIILHTDFIKDHCYHAAPGYFIKGSRGRLTKRKSEMVLHTKQIDIASWEKGVMSRINATHLPLLAPLLYGDPHNTRNVKGCNMAYWRSDAIAVNGYNNSIAGWGHEDIEFAARLANSGIKRRQLKLAAVCYHIHHNLASRSSEEDNLKAYEEVVAKKIAWCDNGIEQV